MFLWCTNWTTRSKELGLWRRGEEGYGQSAVFWLWYLLVIYVLLGDDFRIAPPAFDGYPLLSVGPGEILSTTYFLEYSFPWCPFGTTSGQDCDDIGS